MSKFVIIPSGADVPIYVGVPGAAGDGVADDRAAIIAALDAAEALAVAGGRAIVMLQKDKVYRLVPALYVPTSGSSAYGCLPIPSNVTLDLNGSTLKAEYTGADATFGAVIFPKGLGAVTTSYGAASNWCVRNGRIEVSHSTEERTGNLLVFSCCENVLWEDLSLGNSLFHSMEIQSGRNLTARRIRIDGTAAGSHPEIQFDHSGDPATARNAGFTMTAPVENILLQDVEIVGFKPEGSGQTRRVEFGHSAGVYRNITLERCRFAGIYGNASGDTTDGRQIIEIGNGAVSQDHFENIIIRDCWFNHDCVAPDAACIYSGTTTQTRLDNILVENCWFTGNFATGIHFGSSDLSTTPLGGGMGNRKNIVIRNNTIAPGQWSSQSSGGTYNARPTATQTSGSRFLGICVGKCESVTLRNNRVILPAAFGANVNASRFYYGYWLMNNQSLDWANNVVEFWNTIGSTNHPSSAAGAINGARIDCDEIVNTLGLPCTYICDGFTADTRKLCGVVAATDDTFTLAGHWVVDGEPVTIEYSGSIGGAFTSGTTYFARDITANTFKLAATLGGAALDVTSGNTGVIVRKARVFNYAYEEDPITAGAGVRLSGRRNGVQVMAPASVATAATPTQERMAFPNVKINAQVATQFDKTNTTLADITGLSVPVLNGVTYRFRAVLYVDADATGGYKFAVGGTCTATAIKARLLVERDDTGASVVSSRLTALGGAGAGAAGGTALVAVIEGIITVNAAGNLTIQFAQNAANGTSSILTLSNLTVERA